MYYLIKITDTWQLIDFSENEKELTDKRTEKQIVLSDENIRSLSAMCEIMGE